MVVTNQQSEAHLGAISLSATVDVDVLRRMARRHLVGAAYFARESFRLESSGLAREQAESPNQGCATAAIMLSVAALEAAINEFYLNAVDSPMGALQKLTPAAFGLLRTNWPGLQKAETLEKYQSALCDCGKPQLSKGAAPYQDAHLLVRLRNALVHFKPEWDSSQGQHLTVEKDLRGKFLHSRFSAPTASFLPNRCLGHGCAEWAVRSAAALIDGFHDKLWIESILAGSTSELSTRWFPIFD